MSIVIGAWQPDLLDCTFRSRRADSQHAVSINPQNDLTLRIQILHEVATVFALKFSCYRCRGWCVAHDGPCRYAAIQNAKMPETSGDYASEMRGGIVSESTKFRLNIALLVGTIVAALHLFLGIG